MISVSVKANFDAATALDDMPALLLVVQRRGVNEIKKHFLERNREPNAMGWPKRNFWAREGRDNTGAGDVTADSASVVIASAAIAHKLSGGKIEAKRGKFLAIPMTAEAYAAGSPREGNMPGLFLIVRKGETARAFLATANALTTKTGKEKKVKGSIKPRTAGGIEMQYLLVRSVTQAADPRTLPDLDDLGGALQNEADKFVARRIKKSA